jgi:hypothetical protein
VAEFDRLKEEVGPLKLWEGVAVVIVSGLGAGSLQQPIPRRPFRSASLLEA